MELNNAAKAQSHTHNGPKLSSLDKLQSKRAFSGLWDFLKPGIAFK